jgi:hypothetical protein
LGSRNHFHFVHKRSLNLRTRRDTSVHKSVLANENSIKTIEQQHGYKRVKRGYRSLEDLKKQFPGYEAPQDPYFKHQWYLVCYILLKISNFKRFEV